MMTAENLWRWGVLGLQGASSILQKISEDPASGKCPKSWLDELKVYHAAIGKIIAVQESKPPESADHG